MFSSYSETIIIHQGALGDFLLSLPAIISIQQHFRPSSIYWWGKSQHTFWFKKLNIPSLPSAKARLLLELFKDNYPEELEKSLIFWFKISTRSRITFSHPNIFYLYLVDENNPKPVRSFLKEQLQKLNLPWSKNWKAPLKKEFVPPKKEKILLFPGSGHRAKNWPLENYVKLSEKLKTYLPTFLIFGPVEQELYGPASLSNILTLNSLEDLINTLQQALLVIGNDAGPLHLAGLLEIPTLTLFGPTNSLIWKPEQSEVLKSPLSCAPCSATAQITCSKPRCLKAIKVEEVFQKTLTLLKKTSKFS